MKYSHNDTDLLRQPIGYWSSATAKAVVKAIRAGLTQFDATQPQFWVLGQLSTAENGRSRAELTAALRGYLNVGDDLEREMDALLDRKLIAPDEEGRLHPTAEGDALFRTCVAFATTMRERIHSGVTDEEYLVTLKVLQRMIHNVGGEAWHH
jgi:hypothetical protein